MLSRHFTFDAFLSRVPTRSIYRRVGEQINRAERQPLTGVWCKQNNSYQHVINMYEIVTKCSSELVEIGVLILNAPALGNVIIILH